MNNAWLKIFGSFALVLINLRRIVVKSISIHAPFLKKKIVSHNNSTFKHFGARTTK